MNDAGRSQNRKSSDDAEPAVPGFFGDPFASRNRNLDLDVFARVLSRGDLFDDRPHHLARRRVDGRFAGSDRQTGLCHRAHPFSRFENDPLCRKSRFDDDCGAMGDVGIIASILDNPGSRKTLSQLCNGQRKRHLFAARQHDLYRIWKRAGRQSRERGLCCGCRTSAGGPPASEFC